MPKPQVKVNKASLRKELKKTRHELSERRRAEAAEGLFISLLSSVTSYTSVLSFSSLSDEIDTSLLNRFLASTRRLLLPKVVEVQLKIYRVTNLERQLEQGAFGIFEPIPSKCDEVLHEEIEVVLVPALGFDKSNHRIGYGKGYYDRFLAPLTTSCQTIGIGFREQFVDTFPKEPTDLPLTCLNLF